MVNGAIAKSYVRGCYFTNWAQYRSGLGKYSPDSYTPGLCTHMLYAFLTFDDSFTLKSAKFCSFLIGSITGNFKFGRALEWNDETSGGTQGQIEKINNLKKADANLKTLASVGGYSFGVQ